MGNLAPLGHKYQPHWVWAIGFILVPFCLTALGFIGISRESFVPLSIASLGPQLAVLVSLGGFVAAVARRRRIAFGIVAVGAAVSVGGLLLLMWLG